MPRRKVSRRESSRKKSRGWLTFLEWLSTIAVFLSVGLAMIGTAQTKFVLPYWVGGQVTTIIVGWIIVLAVLAEILIEIFRK